MCRSGSGVAGFKVAITETLQCSRHSLGLKRQSWKPGTGSRLSAPKSLASLTAVETFAVLRGKLSRDTTN